MFYLKHKNGVKAPPTYFILAVEGPAKVCQAFTQESMPFPLFYHRTHYRITCRLAQNVAMYLTIPRHAPTEKCRSSYGKEQI